MSRQITAAAFTAFSHLKVAQNNEYLQAVRDGAPEKSGAFVINLLTESERMLVIKGLVYTITLWYVTGNNTMKFQVAKVDRAASSNARY